MVCISDTHNSCIQKRLAGGELTDSETAVRITRVSLVTHTHTHTKRGSRTRPTAPDLSTKEKQGQEAVWWNLDLGHSAAMSAVEQADACAATWGMHASQLTVLTSCGLIGH